MRTGRNNIVFIGRYVDTEKLSGPEKFSKRIFENIASLLPTGNVSFIQYFFDGREYSLREKISGFQESEQNGLKVYRTGLYRFYRILRQLRPDIIHITAFERFSVIAVLYRLLNRSKVIYTCNGVVRYENKELKEVSLFYRLKDSICERMIFSFSDRIIFPSANALELSKEYYKKAALKAEVIPNGIDEAFRLIPGNAPARANTGRTINAVFIYKNEMNDSGLKFLKEFLSGTESRIVVHIITNHKIDISGVNSEIKLVQPMNTEELAEFYRDKDVFFSLNKYDTFSISTAEAMAAGLIPVVTNQTGISSCIEHGVNGFTLNYGDTLSLSGIIKEIVTMDDSKRLEMKRNASAIYDKLNWNAAAESYMHHYKQLAGDQND